MIILVYYNLVLVFVVLAIIPIDDNNDIIKKKPDKTDDMIRQVRNKRKLGRENNRQTNNKRTVKLSIANIHHIIILS